MLTRTISNLLREVVHTAMVASRSHILIDEQLADQLVEFYWKNKTVSCIFACKRSIGSQGFRLSLQSTLMMSPRLALKCLQRNSKAQQNSFSKKIITCMLYCLPMWNSVCLACFLERSCIHFAQFTNFMSIKYLFPPVRCYDSSQLKYKISKTISYHC